MGTAVQGSRLGGTWEAEVGMPREMPKVTNKAENVPKSASVADCPVVALKCL